MICLIYSDRNNSTLASLTSTWKDTNENLESKQKAAIPSHERRRILSNGGNPLIPLIEQPCLSPAAPKQLWTENRFIDARQNPLELGRRYFQF